MLPSHTVENYLKAIFQAQIAPAAVRAAGADGPAGLRAGRRPGNRHDHGQGAGGVGARPVRALRGRPADGGRREARRAGPAPPPADRAVPGAGDGDELDRSARRGRAPRARGLRSAHRTHRRDARPARGRPARRSDPGPEGTSAGRVRHAADLSARAQASRCARERSGQRVPALRRAPRPEAGASRAGRGARRGGRQRPLRGHRIASSRSARAPRRRCSSQAARAVLLVCLLAASAFAQTTPTPSAPARQGRPSSPSPITDNSFLVEEAFNQEAGIFQNIFDAIFVNSELGVQLHAGVAGRLADAPVLVHAVGARQR